ncbi:MAG TPA: GAF domain-containing protein, partial [Candidatus Acidoferrum sp.]|nr:GAF domain-containing protein [Candidatus Acidoferrum sp.]
MNRENYSSVTGGVVGVSGVRPIVSAENSIAPGSDEAFQKLLLRISAQASGRGDTRSLIQFFCRATREFFQVSGVYFWRCQTGDELVGEQADGKLTERFTGIRLRFEQSAVTADAVRQRRTTFANHVRSRTFPGAVEFDAHSLLAAPLVVCNEVIGAVTFLHDSEDEFFDENLATKATILAGQLGTLLEAARLGDECREEHRRAAILADISHALHG